MPASMTIATIITIITCRSIIPTPLRFSASRGSRMVAQAFDLALQAVFLLDRDPLEHVQTFLELLDLGFEAPGGFALLDLPLPIAAAAMLDPQRSADQAGHHHDQDDGGDH